jgi:hypothetical protein
MKPSIAMSVLLVVAACGGGKNHAKPDAADDSGPLPQCNDGIDNDGDGKIDFPYDPGCYAPNQDDETDDCPDGPNCPQCGNGQDDDGNGKTDYPDDSGGCTMAADSDEYTDDPLACGAPVRIKPFSADGHMSGMLMGSTSNLVGRCGGAGPEDVYELRIQQPKVVVASTNMGTTSADTVLYLRTEQCTDEQMELACNDDVSTGNPHSTITYSIAQPGTYYLVVDTKTSTGGTYDLQVDFFTGEGQACGSDAECGPGLVCRIPLNGTSKVCAKHVCSDGADDDADGKDDFPNDPGCTDATDDDETDDCPAGPNCPDCGDGSDNDTDTLTDYPADYACASAAGASELFCTGETDATAVITTKTTTGTTTGKHNDLQPTLCSNSSFSDAPELAYALVLPVPVDTLALDTDGSSYDTMLYVRDAQCTADIACNDDGTIFPQSELALTNVQPGAYAVVVDGYNTNTGNVQLHVQGTVAAGTDCSSPLFTGGANAVLLCPNGTTCTGTPLKCQ